MPSNVINYFLSDYLRYAMWALLLYAGVYGLAFILAKFGSADRTILFRCRRAWAVAMLIHLLIVAGLTVKWLIQYGWFPSIGYCGPWYAAMLIFDFYFIFSASRSINRFASY